MRLCSLGGTLCVTCGFGELFIFGVAVGVGCGTHSSERPSNQGCAMLAIYRGFPKLFCGASGVDVDDASTRLLWGVCAHNGGVRGFNGDRLCGRRVNVLLARSINSSGPGGTAHLIVADQWCVGWRTGHVIVIDSTAPSPKQPLR
jgi:hypothetical protein